MKIRIIFFSFCLLSLVSLNAFASGPGGVFLCNQRDTPVSFVVCSASNDDCNSPSFIVCGYSSSINPNTFQGYTFNGCILTPPYQIVVSDNLGSGPSSGILDETQETYIIIDKSGNLTRVTPQECYNALKKKQFSLQ